MKRYRLICKLLGHKPTEVMGYDSIPVWGTKCIRCPYRYPVYEEYVKGGK